MTKNINKLCKSKNCNNLVLNGKYCEYCKQKRKEKRDQILGIMGGTFIVGIFAAAKKGVLKQAPAIAAKVFGAIFHI